MTHRPVDIGDRKLVLADPGPAPMLQWVKVDLLVINDAYQRPLGEKNWTAINKIAANFLWSRFHPLVVAPIEGGRFAVIDGQHRAHAAMLCEIREVPAVVVMVDVAEQARAFAWVNSQSIRVSVFHTFKAALVSGEDWALRADAAVSAAGCRLMRFHASSAKKQAGEVYCVALIRKLIQGGYDQAISAALAALRAVPALDRPAMYSDFILRPWIAAVAAADCPPRDVLIRALQLQDPFKVIERAQADLGRSASPVVKACEALRQLIVRAEVSAGLAA